MRQTSFIKEFLQRLTVNDEFKNLSDYITNLLINKDIILKIINEGATQRNDKGLIKENEKMYKLLQKQNLTSDLDFEWFD